MTVTIVAALWALAGGIALGSAVRVLAERWRAYRRGGVLVAGRQADGWTMGSDGPRGERLIVWVRLREGEDCDAGLELWMEGLRISRNGKWLFAPFSGLEKNVAQVLAWMPGPKRPLELERRRGKVITLDGVDYPVERAELVIGGDR